MSAHHDKIDVIEVIFVWLPIFSLASGRWLIPNGGAAELLIACAGWSNLVALVAIGRELAEEKAIGRRALTFIIPIVAFPFILAWDLIHVLHASSLTLTISLLALSAVILGSVAIIHYLSTGKILIICFAYAIFLIAISFFGFLIPFSHESIARFLLSNLGDEHWWAQPVIERLHVWTHLLLIPLIYLTTDAIQYFFLKKGNPENKFKKFVFYDFIMLSIGGAFATAGWYIAFPTATDHHPINIGVGVEEVAAAAILVLWNIAYVHLYPSAVSDANKAPKNGDQTQLVTT